MVNDVCFFEKYVYWVGYRKSGWFRGVGLCWLRLLWDVLVWFEDVGKCCGN